ncbi:hypothetical protein B566_EDAN004734 [Ephemera danica]|nr:hypothetical protein B566_EDAN004734 [Ephemera danica]
MVIAAVLTTRRLRTVTNCFVTSLAVADWLVAVFRQQLPVHLCSDVLNFSTQITYCMSRYDKNRHINQECTYNENIGYVVFSSLGSFFVPLVVMLYVYARISCVIARRMDPLEQAAAAEHDAALGQVLKLEFSTKDILLICEI